MHGTFLSLYGRIAVLTKPRVSDWQHSANQYTLGTLLCHVLSVHFHRVFSECGKENVSVIPGF
jgi:hypothetical protein